MNLYGNSREGKNVVKEFFAKFDVILRNMKNKNIIIIMWDLNAKVGKHKREVFVSEKGMRSIG